MILEPFSIYINSVGSKFTSTSDHASYLSAGKFLNGADFLTARRALPFQTLAADPDAPPVEVTRDEFGFTWLLNRALLDDVLHMAGIRKRAA